jgi:HSP20 family protein
MYFEFQAEPRPGATWTPVVDVCEHETEIVIFVETPGVDRSDLQVSWNDGVLIVSGHKRQESPDRQMATYLCVERFYGQFRREIAIGIPIDHKRAKAELRDGLLKIQLPKLASKLEVSNIPIS